MSADEFKKNKTAVIWGANGQDGYYLKQLLEKQNVCAIGISRNFGDITGDVTDYKFVTAIIQKYHPDFMFNFAAISTVNHDTLFEQNEIIGRGTLNILEAVRLYAPESKIFLAGSALQFLNNGNPIDENTPFEASSVYASARIYAAYLARYYRKAFLQKIYMGYLFNHDSPLRTENHINQKIAKAALRIAKGSEEKLYLGDMSVRKEFSHARDIVEAIWILINQDEIYEAVIGSGTDYSIKDWVEICFGFINLPWQKYIIVKNDYKPQYHRLVSRPDKIFSLGWKPKETFESLAICMMEEKV